MELNLIILDNKGDLMKDEIWKIVFNWCQYQAGQKAESYYLWHEVGEVGVESIKFVVNGLPTDHYQVDFIDGSMEQIFNPNRVFYRKVKDE